MWGSEEAGRTPLNIWTCRKVSRRLRTLLLCPVFLAALIGSEETLLPGGDIYW